MGFGFALSLTAHAQSIKNTSDFEVQSYRIEQRGYPNTLSADSRGHLVYTEWWQAGQGGRRHSAYYLQSVDPAKFEEVWFRALSKAGEPLFTPVQLIRLGEVIAVVGRVPDPATKGENLVVRFFTQTGPEKGNGFVLQRFAKSPGQLVTHLAADPTGRRLLYYSTDLAQPTRSREHFCAVVTAEGQIQWSRALELQSAGIGAKNLDKYQVKPPVIDRNGVVSFLTIPTVYGGSIADALLPPRILRYDPRTKIITELPVKFGYTFCEAALQQTASDELIVLAILTDGTSVTSFWNGKSPERGGDGKGKNWSRLGYERYGADGKLKVSKRWALPDSIGIPYIKLLPNLSDQRIVYSPTTTAGTPDVYWMWEEAYRGEGGRGNFVRGEVATLAVDTKADSLVWGRRLVKRQRDPRNDQLQSYAVGLTEQWLRLVYITESGASGKLAASSFNRAGGGLVHKDLIANTNLGYTFFPDRAVQTAPDRLILLGTGLPGTNSYRFVQLKLD
jgi:hypothetical protein